MDQPPSSEPVRTSLASRLRAADDTEHKALGEHLSFSRTQLPRRTTTRRSHAPRNLTPAPDVSYVHGVGALMIEKQPGCVSDSYLLFLTVTLRVIRNELRN